MTTEFSNLIEGPLEGKQKLIFDAVQKMLDGKKLYEQGHTEFVNLTMEAPKIKVRISTKKVKKTAKTKVANKKVSTFRMDERPDAEIGKEIVSIVRDTGSATINFLGKRLKLGERRTGRIVGQLVAEDKLEWTGEGVRGKPKSLRIPSKKVNGNHAPKPNRQGPHPIDVTDEALLAKAKKLFETKDWVTKGVFIKEMDLSRIPATRLLDHLEKTKVVKQVMKKNNPAHKNEPRCWDKEMPYFELN